MVAKVKSNETTISKQDILRRLEIAVMILNSLTDEELESIGNGKGTLYYESLQT